MTDDVSKLPAWPDLAEYTARFGEDGMVDMALYNADVADAYCARVEALKKRLEQWRKHMRHVVTEEELAEVDALLAACEREEGR